MRPKLSSDETCPVCNVKFYLKPFHKKRYKGPFCCSRKCRGEFIREVYSGSNNPNYKYKSNLEKFFATRNTEIQSRAKRNGLSFNLTAEYLFELYNKQNGLCFYTGIPLKIGSTNFKNKGQADLDTLSVDKIESEKGYIQNNIVLCCSGVNKLKGNASKDELKDFLLGLGLKSFGTCKVKFKKLRKESKNPFRASLGDGGYDLSVAHFEDLGDKVKVYTGIACEPSEGWVLFALPRSSIVKSGFRLSNSIGLIDNKFRGEILAIFDKKDLNAKIEIGQRIIQLVPIRTPFVEFIEVEELSKTERGTGGFGSSGS